MSTTANSAMVDLVMGLLPNIPEPRTVLIAGSGPERMPEWHEGGFAATYLDIEPRDNPDIVADMCNMGEIGPYSIIYCCHALEHLYPHEVPWALNEFNRVLRPGGIVVIIVPDLEGVQATEEPLYYTPEGAMTGLHLIYGDARQIQNFPAMAHHCGFVEETLRQVLVAAGFLSVTTNRMGNYHLVGVGLKK